MSEVSLLSCLMDHRAFLGKDWLEEAHLYLLKLKMNGIDLQISGRPQKPELCKTINVELVKQKDPCDKDCIVCFPVCGSKVSLIFDISSFI